MVKRMACFSLEAALLPPERKEEQTPKASASFVERIIRGGHDADAARTEWFDCMVHDSETALANGIWNFEEPSGTTDDDVDCR